MSLIQNIYISNVLNILRLTSKQVGVVGFRRLTYPKYKPKKYALFTVVSGNIWPDFMHPAGRDRIILSENTLRPSSRLDSI